MTNINGKTYAMNTITPMNAFYTPILKLIFFILGHVKPLQADLINLSFIHFARWVVVKRHKFPRLRNQSRRVRWGCGLFGVQQLVDLNHQFRQLMQPREPRIVQHQLEQLAFRFNARNVVVVHRGLGIQQGLMEMEQPVAKIGEALTRHVRR